MLTETRACERLKARSYDPTSFHALAQLVAEHGGHLVAGWSVAFITSRPRADGLPFHRQHVMWTDSGTVLIETAFAADSSNGLRDKVYSNALVPAAGGVRFETLDRRRPNHYVWSGAAPWWLTTSSVVTA